MGIAMLSVSNRSFSGRVINQGRPSIQSQFRINHAGSFNAKWLNADPLVLVLGFIGWTIPSAIPVSSFEGDSLFFKFTSAIGAELAHFPTGPSLDSAFWIYFLLYHIGLFTCLLAGQIGVQGRKRGYFSKN